LPPCYLIIFADTMDTLETLKTAIENRLCPVHDIHPLVEVTGDDLDIICCCELFYARCLREVGNIKYQMELERSLEIE
jgi:hypothetical protein